MQKWDWLQWFLCCIKATPTLRPHPLRPSNTEVSITVNIKVAMASELDLKIKRVGREHDLWDTAGLFGVFTANVVQARQIHAYTVCWHHTHTHMRPLGSGCTMATRECVYVSIDVCVLYMSLLVGCIGRWCVYEGICLVDAFKALGVLHRHQKLLAQVFKRLVRREVQAIKAEREENGTIKEINEKQTSTCWKSE